MKLVRDAKADPRSRKALITILGEDPEPIDAARRTLRELLARDRSPQIRAECAEALEDATTTDPELVKLLLNRLDKDKSEVVRAQCAEALRHVAPSQPEVRTRLETSFTSGSEIVRAGAAKGLSGLDFSSPDQEAILDRFLRTITDLAEPARVRCAS